MATIEECEQALHGLAAKLGGKDSAGRTGGFDRSLSCTLKDLKIIFAGRLHDGELTDIAQVDKAEAQVRLTMSSDDLLSMVDGTMNIASAWASGRVKVQAGVRDLIKLRSIF